MEQQSPRRKAIRELIALAAVSTVGLIYLGTNWEIRPPTFMVGRVTGFGLVEQKGYGQVGSIVRAQVELPGYSSVSISLPNGALCRVGSQIEIEEAVYIRSRRKATSMTTPTGVDQANDPLHQNAWSRNIQPRSTGHQRQAAQPAGTLQLFRIAR